MYTYNTKTRLRDTDASGYLYFCSIIDLAHEAYESYLRTNNLDIGELIKSGKYLIPLVRVESDFLKIIYAGDEISISLICDKIGSSSFTISYSFENSKREILARIKTVHVTIDKESKSKINIPYQLKGALQQIKF
ncbi:acyl-CoA thioesterase [candidate division KSB1 bacterium]